MQKEINKPQRPTQPGKRMLAAWEYISTHPGCSEALIRINYGQQTINNMIKYNMIDIRDGAHDRELCSRDGWQHEHQQLRDQQRDSNMVNKASQNPDSLSAAALRLKDSTSLRHVPCMTCKAEVGAPCTATSRSKYTPGRLVTPHAARQLSWIYAVLREHGEIEFSHSKPVIN